MELLREWSNKIKVHRLLCLELKKFLDRVSLLFCSLESVRPRCKPGIQALCSLHEAMDKANLLIQHCSDCSKFYLAMTAHSILLRCERIRNAMALSMNQVKNVVPPSLAAKISGIINQLISAKFPLEPSEHEAGTALLALLKHDIPASGSFVQQEVETLQLAALRLNITSPLALLLERRAIRKLLSKVHDVYPRKEKILSYLLYLLKKYGNFIWRQPSESVNSQHEENYSPISEMEVRVKCDGVETPSNVPSIFEPPKEFKCPISGRLFYDPVVIASGNTFERAWIEYWFSDGQLTCPVTRRRLEHFALTSNLSMKSLITKWCATHGIHIHELSLQPAPIILKTMGTSSSSITSFGSSVDDLQLQVSGLSLNSSDSDHSLDPPNGEGNDDSRHQLPEVNANFQVQMCHSPMTTSADRNCGISLSKLSALSWGSQCKIVQRVRELIKENDKSWQSTFSESSLLLLIRFLKCASELCDVKVQKDGAEVLLEILSHCRIELPPSQEDVIYVLASLLDSELTLQSLGILEVLSHKQYYNSRIVASGILPSILKVFDNRIKESHELAMKILCNLSNNDDIGHHILYLDYVQKFTSLLADPDLAGYCIELIKKLCKIEEARSTVATTVAESDSCLNSIASLLEYGSRENQEHALDVLLSLCHEQARFCRLVMTESIVQSLANIYVSGNSRGQVIALELLLLGRKAEADDFECVTSRIDPNPQKAGFRNQPADEASSLKALRWVRKGGSRFSRASH